MNLFKYVAQQYLQGWQLLESWPNISGTALVKAELFAFAHGAAIGAGLLVLFVRLGNG